MLRRQLLKAITAAPLLALGSRLYGAELPQPGPRLVVVLLRGGLDGLGAVVPWSDADYRAARPRIGLGAPGTAGGVLDLDGRFGLHPALAPLMPLWSAGLLACVHACGSPDPTRSHFDAQDDLDTGTPGRRSTASGWLNRLLTELPQARGPTAGLSVGTQIPRLLSGPRPVAMLASGRGAGRASAMDRPGLAAALDRLYAPDDALGRAWRTGRAARAELMAGLNGADAGADREAEDTARGWSGDAIRLARLMRNEPKLRAAALALGGWDTHISQGSAEGQLARRLGPLADGLAAFAQALGPLLAETLVVVVSEFGRTVRENGNGGTDHGHGGVLWLLGGRVHGGRMHGDWPGLGEAARWQGRDLAVSTDFRTVLWRALGAHFALDDAALARVLPGFTPPAGALGGLIG